MGQGYVMSLPLSAEGFASQADVSRETLARLEAYAALLIKWNKRINLVSRASLADLWRRHMLDSAQLITALPPPPIDRPRRLVDLGSGAGFPGLVLAALGARDVHLIEADRRKVEFLRAAARAMDTSVTVHPGRSESVAPLAAGVVTARACAPDLVWYPSPL